MSDNSRGFKKLVRKIAEEQQISYTEALRAIEKRDKHRNNDPKAREHLLSIIKKSVISPSPSTIVVSGAPGSGKTHLVGSLLEEIASLKVAVVTDYENEYAESLQNGLVSEVLEPSRTSIEHLLQTDCNVVVIDDSRLTERHVHETELLKQVGKNVIIVVQGIGNDVESVLRRFMSVGVIEDTFIDLIAITSRSREAFSFRAWHSVPKQLRRSMMTNYSECVYPGSSSDAMGLAE